jgi:hypothetical protein
MKKKFILLMTIYWILLIGLSLKVLAEEEWTINKLENHSYAAVSGEVIHGDTLNFFISAVDNCTMVWNIFYFYTYEKPGDIKQLLNKHVPIKINGKELSAEVITVRPFLMGYRVGFSLGEFPLKEYTYFLKEFYEGFKKYEIEIVDGLDFKASKYFDINTNNWKLDNLVPSIKEASKACKEIGSNDS